MKFLKFVFLAILFSIEAKAATKYLQADSWKSANGSVTVTLPAVSGTLVGVSATQTVEGKTLLSPIISGTMTGGVYTGTVSGTVSGSTINADNNTITNIENADIKSGAAIDAAKISDGSVSNTEFGYLNGVGGSLIGTDKLGLDNYVPTSSWASGIPGGSIKQISPALYIRVNNKVLVWGGAYFRNDAANVNISWSVPVTSGSNLTNIVGEMRRSNASGETSTTRSRLSATGNSSGTTIAWIATGISTSASDSHWEYHFVYTLP